MNIVVQENGSRDPEVRSLDSRLPYFCQKIKDFFIYTPEEIKIVIINTKEKIEEITGQKLNVSTKGNVVYALEPELLTQRNLFYKKICQEVMYIFYKKNKNN